MTHSTKTITLFLLFPVVALLALTVYKKSIVTFGKEVILPITGYDPRDLLSGHYLIYRIDYGVDATCTQDFIDGQPAYMCLEPKMFTFFQTGNCEIEIVGTCNLGRFEAGIEKFYVPQEKAYALERLIQSKKASIVLAVPPKGKAQVKDLLIEGIPWAQALKEPQK